MDCSVVKTRHPGLFLISTTDFFYPLVEDPYLQGRIAACNVLSDLYAMGVADVDTMLMILASSSQMTEHASDIVTTELIRGFNDCAKEADTNVTGGQTVINPWPMIGGEASALCGESEFIRPTHAVAGDVIVLTKPVGTQVAVNLQEWQRKPARWAKVEHVISRPDATAAYQTACESMGRLNRGAAKAMVEFGAHAATDVTGFGLLGHLQNLAEHQSESVDLILDTMPVIRGMPAVDTALGGMFKLTTGYSAETSGGLLVCVPADAADAYIAAVSASDGQPAWRVGRVVAGSNSASIATDLTIIEV